MTCNDWMDTPLGDITKWTSGGTPSKSNPLFWNGNIPWISAKTLTSGWIDSSDLTITEEGLEAGSNLAPTQSVLMLVRGSGLFNHRYIGIVKEPVAFNQDIKCIQAKANLNPLFLYYLLQGYDNEIVGMLEATSIGAGKFDTKRLQEMKVSLPPLPEQRAIAATLSCLDDKIELNNRMNKTLEEMAQAIFKSWFVDFEPFQDGEFVDSELGSIPKGWRVGTLSDCVALITRGITPRYTNSSNQLVINQKCIRNHEVSLQQARTHSSPVTSLKELVYGDVLINSTGQGTLGRSAQWFMHYNNITVDSHVTIVRAVNLETAYYIGQCIMQRELEIEDMATGSTGQTELATKRLLSMKIVIPFDVILQKFENMIEPITQKIIINAHEKHRLMQLRDTLLPKLMNGDLLIPVEV